MSRASQPVNPFIGKTYIPDNTRVETPPAWFLQALYDYDSQLVLFPSRQRPFAYVIARRSRLGRRGLTQVLPETQPDTKMVMHWGCVPVCMMFKHGPVWSADAILQKLKARDMWAHGGADKVADMLEEQEAAEQKKRDDAKREELWHLSGEAWRSYQARTKQSTLADVGRARNGAAHQSAPLVEPRGQVSVDRRP